MHLLHLLWLLLPGVLAALAIKVWQWDHPDVPQPKGHWLLGHTRMVSPKVHMAIIKTIRECGPLACLRLFHFKVYICSDPEAASRVLRGGPSVAAKFSAIYWPFDRMTHPPCRTIISVPDDDPFLKPVRAAAAHAFSTANLRALFPRLVETADAAYLAAFDASARLASAGVSGAVDLDMLFLRVTIDVMGHFTFGRGFGACAGGPCPELEIVDRECEVVMAGAFNYYAPLMFWRKDRWRQERWNQEFAAMMKRLVAEMKAAPPPPHTLGAQLLAVTDAAGNPIPDLRLHAEASIFVMAGFENTSHAASIALFAIVAHPGVEERVCAELEALGLLSTPACPEPRALQWEDLSKLRVLSAAVQESLRWMPVAPAGTGRLLQQPMEICGKVLPRNSLLWFPTIGVHRDPHNWDRPDAYDIDRWLGAGDAPQEPGADGTKERRGFIPFVEGGRSCPGQSLARVEIVAVLALLLSRHRVELAPEVGGAEGFVERLEMKMSLRPKGGMPCLVTPRVAAR